MATIKDLLEATGSYTTEDYDKAIEKSKAEQISLMFAIEQQNLIEEQTLLEIFSKHLKIQKVDLSKMDIPPNIIELVPKEIAIKFRLIPIDRAGNNIFVAMGDPRNLQAIDTIRFKAGYLAKPVLASELRISEAMEKYYGKMDFSNLSSGPKKDKDHSRSSIGTGIEKDDGPIIKIVNDILIQCLNRGASDIHVEIYENFMRFRLRIDGSLVEIARPPANLKAPLVSRIKIMSGLNIAETRLPQDGAINITIGQKPVDFRVNSIPTAYGEKIVLRILDKSNLQVDMTQLGFEPEQLKGFKHAIESPHGMVLVTGPTGSGKTTTIYSALQELNREDVNVMTAEDPVEYNLPGINQVQMKSDIGLNFSAALRAFLRQDPDVIMVGEIRDLETAEISMKAALTGHMVLSTLHTNSAADTVTRLLSMGVASFNLISALSCVTAQRLMKKICVRCKEDDPSITSKMLVEFGIPEVYAEKIRPQKGKGCPACSGTGNKGRVAVHEVLLMNEAVRKAIVDMKTAGEIKKIAMSTGMKSMRQSALTKMAQGVVTLGEVAKTTTGDF